MITARTLYASLLLISITAICIAAAPMAPELWGAWQTDEYSHGIMIPFLALLLGAHILAEKPIIQQSSWTSIICITIAAMGFATAILAAFHAAAHYGFIIALIGISLAFLGKQATAKLLPAYIYLWFAVPLPHLFQSNLSQQLQLLSSSSGVTILQLLGISVYQEGNIIDLGAFQLQVVDACSGLRYLFPLMSFGFLAAYLFKAALWKRIIIFVSTIPITISMNILRISIIGVTVEFWGPSMAEGLIHDFEGWVVFAACVLLLLAEIALLARIGKGGTFRLEYFSLPPMPKLASPLRIQPPMMATTVLCLLIATIISSGAISNHIKPTPALIPLALFPKTLQKWSGTDRSLPTDVLANLRLSDYWIADYTHPDHNADVNFYMAYYDKQQLGSATHSPSNCIPAGGWRIKNSETLTLSSKDGLPINITRLIIAKGPLKQLVYFWFNERGRTVTQTTYAKWYLLIDAATLGRTDGALIRASTAILSEESAQQADNRLQAFISLAQPEITRFIPSSTSYLHKRDSQ